MQGDIFQAIADPTRRGILHLLASQTMNLNAVANNFEISRPAISKHMKILTECGLVSVEKRGRERFCEVNIKKLDEVTDWVDSHRKFWNIKLNSLDEFLTLPGSYEKKIITSKKLKKRK